MIACGLTSLLTPAIILLIAIALDVSFMFGFLEDDSIINVLQNVEEYDKPVWVERLCRQIILVLDLSFACLALRGVLKRNQYLLLPFLFWSIILTSALGYFIYLKCTEELNSISRRINVLMACLPWPKYGSRERIFMDLVLLAPAVVFKVFMIMRVWSDYWTISSVRPKKSSQYDLKDLKVVLGKQFHETMNRHISRSHP